MSSEIFDESIVPGSLEACAIEESRRPDMRNKINQFAKDEEDRALLLAMILDE